MKAKKNAIGRARWVKAWLIQLIEALIAGLLTALCAGAGPVVRGIALWALMPCAGAVTAFCAMRRGLNNYLAWLAPPVGLYIAHFALWGYAPPAGPALLCALIALVGAAAGEVYRQTHKKK